MTYRHGPAVVREYRVEDYVPDLRSSSVGEQLRRMCQTITSRNNGGHRIRVIFPDNKNYSIQEVSNRPGDINEFYRWPLTFQLIDWLTIEGNGCTITQDGDRGPYTVMGGLKPWGGLKLAHCDNFYVSDLILNGRVDQISRDPNTFEQDTHGVMVLGCHIGKMINVTAKNTAAGDGFLLYHYNIDGQPTRQCEDLVFENCVADRASRNGLSITSGRNLHFKRCSFIRTGDHEFGGHSPGAGCDVEADRHPGDGGPDEPLERTGRILFEKCVFSQNVQRTVVCALQRHEDVTLLNCVLHGNEGQAQSYETALTSPGMKVYGCEIYGGTFSLGHNNEESFPGDDERYAEFIGNRFVVLPGGQSVLCTGPRVRFNNNLVESYGSGVALLGITDNSEIQGNTFLRHTEGHDPLNVGICTLSGCEGEINGNTFSHDTPGYAAPGPDFGSAYVQLDTGTPNPTNSTLDEGVYFSRPN